MRNTPFEAVLKLYALRIFRDKGLLVLWIIWAFASLVHRGADFSSARAAGTWVLPMCALPGLGLWSFLKEQMAGHARSLLPQYLTWHLLVFAFFASLAVVAYPQIMLRADDPVALLAVSLGLFAGLGWWIMSPIPMIQFIAGVITVGGLAVSSEVLIDGMDWNPHSPPLLSQLIIAFAICSIAGTLWYSTRLVSSASESSSESKLPLRADRRRAYMLKQSLYHGNTFWKGSLRWLWLGDYFTNLVKTIAFIAVYMVFWKIAIGDMTAVHVALLILLFGPHGIILVHWRQLRPYLEAEQLKPVSRQTLIRQVVTAVAIQCSLCWAILISLDYLVRLFVPPIDDAGQTSSIAHSLSLGIFTFAYVLWTMQCSSRVVIIGTGMLAFLTASVISTVLVEKLSPVSSLTISTVFAAVGLVWALISIRRWANIEVGMDAPAR